jgi:hypothetical protein
VIDRYALLPAQLEVEVAETSLMYNIDAAVKQVNRCARWASAWRWMTSVRATVRCACCATCPSTPSSSTVTWWRAAGLGGDIALVRSVIELCAAYGITVIAEGVETQAQWLKGNGCAYVQGFLVARPMTADAGDFPAVFLGRVIGKLGAPYPDCTLMTALRYLQAYPPHLQSRCAS